jgi:hypothetical protein
MGSKGGCLSLQNPLHPLPAWGPRSESSQTHRALGIQPDPRNPRNPAGPMGWSDPQGLVTLRATQRPTEWGSVGLSVSISHFLWAAA